MFDIQIINADIIQMDVDCIVCPIHEDLTPAFPIGQRIWEAAGYEQCKRSCQHFVEKPYAAGARASDTLLDAAFVWNVRLKNEEEVPDGHWYLHGLGLTRKVSSVSIPVWMPPEWKDGVEIGRLWRSIIQLLFKAEQVWASCLPDRCIFFVAEDEVVCQIGRLVLQEELDARQEKLSEEVLLKEKQKAEYLLAETIDREKLTEYIILLYQIREIQWQPPKQLENGVWQLGYPVYPKEIFPILHLMEPDYQYRDHLTQIRKQRLRFSELSLSQIQTYLTYLHRGERFCDGLIAEAVKHGTLLKLLLRIHDLINPYPW